jgi:hypothetical protein
LNPYYQYSGSFIPGVLARAEALAAEFSGVQAGFALLATTGVDTGLVNAYFVTTQGAPTVAYQDGNSVEFKALFANSGPSTINVNSIGVVPLLRFNGTALQAGDIQANTWYLAIYNATFGGFTINGPSSVVTVPGTISTAAPTHKVGLTAAGGVATSALPIDATFAIDQSIAPTWTSLHTFSNGVAGGLAVDAASLQTYMQYSHSGVLLAYTGVAISAGALVSDAAANDIVIRAQAGGFRVSVNGGTSSALSIAPTTGAATFASSLATQALTATSGVIGSPTGGNQGAGTINATGLFVNGLSVLAGTGFVSSITGTANQITASASTGAVTLSLPSQVSLPGDLIVTQALQVQGTGTTGFAGAGVELFSNGTIGAIQAFNRTSSAFIPIAISGSTVTLQYGASASAGLSINTSGAVAISAPSSGNGLTINAATGQVGQLNLQGFTSTAGSLEINLTRTSSANTIGNGPGLQFNDGTVNNTNAIQSGAGSLGFWGFGTGGWVANAQISSAGGLIIGSPTGGNQGAGTINATGLYINGQQLFFGVPQSSNTTAAVSDVGKCINATGTITVPNSVFSAGHVFSIYNNSGSSITISAGVTTMRLAGTATTGSRTLAQRGLATVWFESGTECVVGGPGVS